MILLHLLIIRSNYQFTAGDRAADLAALDEKFCANVSERESAA